MTRRVEVTTGSRLHFGLFGVGDGPDAKPGGVGVMIESPRLVMRASAAERFSAGGAHAERTRRVAQRVADAYLAGSLPLLRIETVESPGLHNGLGVGTQHALAVATCVLGAVEIPLPPVELLAEVAGRGNRSAVGSHGFALGGLIVEEGKSGPGLAPLAQRFAVPSQWRFVLVAEETAPGLAGADERQAFSRLKPTPSGIVDELRRLALEQLTPAAEQGSFDRFSAALTTYGELAGSCFADVQGGPFASPAIQRRIAWLRELGAAGCGQSSWGPTVFAAAPDAHSAASLADQIVASGVDRSRLTVAAAANQGAAVRMDHESRIEG